MANEIRPKQNFRDEITAIADSLIYELAMIVPQEGIVFTPELRNRIEDSDHIIPSIFVLEDDGETATLQDIYKITPTEYCTIDGGMIPIRSMATDDLANVYEYLTDVYFPAMSRRYEAQLYMIAYDYEKQAWGDPEDGTCLLQSDAGSYADLQECIDKNLEYITGELDKDEAYRYIHMVIDQIDKDGNAIPNSEVMGAHIFHGKMVKSWNY